MLLRKTSINRCYMNDVCVKETSFRILNSNKKLLNQSKLQSNICYFCEKEIFYENFDPIIKKRKSLFDKDAKIQSNYEIQKCVIHKECSKLFEKCSHKSCPQLYYKLNKNPKCDMCSKTVCSYHQFSTHIPNKDYRYNMCRQCVKNGYYLRVWALKKATPLCDDVIRNIMEFFPKTPHNHLMFIDFNE